MKHAPDLARRPFLDRVLRSARRGRAAYWQRRAENATIAVLQALDDRALRDIGMDRSEIESVVCSAGDRRICWWVDGTSAPESDRGLSGHF